MRHTYHFRWAHRPLCDRFADGALKIGHVHLCRSCTIVYVAIVLTAAAGLLGLLAPSWFPPAVLFLLPPVVTLSQPIIYDRLGRRTRDILRCATGCLMSLMVGLLCHGHLLLGFVSIITFGCAYWIGLSAYRRWKRRACDGCPELGRAGVCSGFQLQADGARRYELAVEQLLFRAPESMHERSASVAQPHLGPDT